MLSSVALAIVALVGTFLLALAAASFFRPASTKSFLLGLAGSPAKHYLELALRLVAGAAFVIAAPRMARPFPFLVFGWVLVATTLILALLPWRWHKVFAQRSVPHAIKFLRAIAVASLIGGIAIVLSAGTAGPANLSR